MIRSILAVCIGNICRSPIAEAVLAHKLPKLSVASAGVGALVGRAADPNAIAVASDLDLDITSHRARQFAREHVDAHDLILVMTAHEREWIRSRYPEAVGRTFLLGHWSGGREVPDPYGHPLAAFEETARLIDAYASTWVERVS